MPCGQVPTLHAPSGRTQVTDVEIPRDALVLITQLGHGEFGDVYRSVRTHACFSFFCALQLQIQPNIDVHLRCGLSVTER